jgi:Glycosyl transferase family 90
MPIGRSYSGSLKYRQLCRSVIVIHKLQWIQHYHYLLIANGTEQNYVEVNRDFSDLETKMEYLISHPEEARHIADNNVKTFRERYFTPAATACYWRALIHGWAASSFQPEAFESTPEGVTRPRGMRFENFAYVLAALYIPGINLFLTPLGL